MKIAVIPAMGVGGNQFTAMQWNAINDVLADEAKIEITTFKQLYIEVPENQFNEIKEQLLIAGLEVYPTGFFTKNLISCNFCRGADEAGLTVAESLNKAIAGIPVPSPLKVGYAGCVNATSEPLFKDIGIVKTPRGFDIYLGGEGRTTKATIARLWLEAVEEKRLMEIIPALISYYQKHGKKKERFSRFVERVTPEALKEAIAS